jgi:H+-translocating NAD(P) transhydrogenase subunit alpha
MIIGIPRETFAGEHRVALVPDTVSVLAALNVEIVVEPGAGESAGFADANYAKQGAHIAADRDEVFSRADVVLQVRTFGANPQAGRADLARTRSGQVFIGASDPLTAGPQLREMAATGATHFAMELIPRITRAQSMDILSSMATIAGYKAVLMAADALPRMFPLLMTAAGTLTPARVLIIGAGVAGLQGIATARRLGAVVQAYDVRPAVKEQIESLGAEFIELAIDAGDSEDAGGYAKAQDETFYRRQREELAKVAGQNDVVVTTAAIPGQPAPLLITAKAVELMGSGSVIIDLASERGGNCELTRPGETIIEHGVQIMGPLNLPATIPNHASQMYSHNISTFLRHLLKEEGLQFDMEDEITRETLVMRESEVVHPRIREADSEGGN